MLDTAYCVAKTLAESARTVVDAALGRLDLARLEDRLATWSRRLVERADIRFEVRGAASIDWARAYVIMSNHQSHFDIPVLYQVVRGPMRMIAKKELFRIPFFGRAMREAKIIEVDRSNRERAIASLKQAGDLLRSGIHVWIAPEGTRSRDGNIGPLKKGGFVVAHDTATPILPVAISGTREVLPPKTARIRRGVRVKVVFGTPIPVEGRSIDDLMTQVQEFLKRHVETE